MRNFCPECGAGIVSNEENGMVVRSPRDYPFDAECETCLKRSTQVMYELGRQAAERIEAEVFAEMLGRPKKLLDIQLGVDLVCYEFPERTSER